MMEGRERTESGHERKHARLKKLGCESFLLRDSRKKGGLMVLERGRGINITSTRGRQGKENNSGGKTDNSEVVGTASLDKK